MNLSLSFRSVPDVDCLKSYNFGEFRILNHDFKIEVKVYLFFLNKHSFQIQISI